MQRPSVDPTASAANGSRTTLFSLEEMTLFLKPPAFSLNPPEHVGRRFYSKEDTANRPAVWVVCTTSAVVREFEELNSTVVDRLLHGARVNQVEPLVEVTGRNGDVVQRLHYKLISGIGPKEGWVSVTYRGLNVMEPEGYRGSI
eukprot:gnl/TRDRNA2_/TRDRNA2_198465_c0_seq1.p1 gnl/TRDRNA2_/TRDRNA2_198465_c0~~gnl/TRDRNA2_/TRDRNA2_198465_c0_seq1.p1  ORF type:complete len:144 (+),score=15.49 gnl/TRDRNA2_/TRDRNA2_198465_c0_seq1:19-450(+)